MHTLYQLTFDCGALYFGVTKDLKQRMRNHENQACLYAGDVNFRVEVLGVYPCKESAEEAEAERIAASPKCRNVSTKGRCGLGTKRAERTRARISVAAKAAWQRPGYRERMAAAHRGKPSANRKVSKEDSAEMQRLHEAGVPTTEIARRFGVPQSTAWNHATGKYK